METTWLSSGKYRPEEAMNPPRNSSGVQNAILHLENTLKLACAFRIR